MSDRWTIYFIGIFLFAFSFLHGQTTPSYSEFKGHVKSVRETSFAAKGKSPDIRKGKPRREYKWQRDFQCTFDSSGLLIEKQTINKSGKTETVSTYAYDVKRLTNLIVVTSGKQSDTTILHNYYNEWGDLDFRVIDSNKYAPRRTLTYTMNKEGQHYEYLADKSGDPQKQKLFTVFDSSWHVLMKNIYSLKGELIAREKCFYDESGRLTCDSMFMPADVPSTVRTWKYDDAGNISRHEVRDPNGAVASWQYKYTFDSTGNWIECIEYRNGKPVFIKERVITYY